MVVLVIVVVVGCPFDVRNVNNDFHFIEYYAFSVLEPSTAR